MKIAIILNSERVPSNLEDTLNDPGLGLKYNLTYDVFIKHPKDLIAFISTLNCEAYNAVIVGGGDGTVRMVAQKLADTDVPLAILPLGTFNFFAKDLNFTNDIDSLFAMIKNNKTKQVDLGQVNEFIFLNHSWIGFYAYILKQKEQYKKILGRSKVLKSIFTAANFFKVLPFYHLNIMTEESTKAFETCLMYVSNNENYTDAIYFGTKKSLTSGLLSVHILNCKTRWQLFKCMLGILFNRFNESKYVTHFSVDAMTVTSKSKLITVVVDGELMKLETPLNYVIHQKKIKVFIP